MALPMHQTQQHQVCIVPEHIPPKTASNKCQIGHGIRATYAYVEDCMKQGHCAKQALLMQPGTNCEKI